MKSFRQFVEGDEGLSYLLGPAGTLPQIGREKAENEGDVTVMRSSHGSTRLVLSVDGKPVSALQVVHRGDNATVANVYTLPEHRRKGLARRLMDRAREMFSSLAHSKHLSKDGEAWSKSV